jgi:hypothetical protein
VRVGELLGGERRHRLRDRVAHRAAVAERAVEAHRERARRVIADHAVHADDAVDLLAERLGHGVARAGVQHQHARRRRGGGDHLRQRRPGHAPVLEVDAGAAVAAPGGLDVPPGLAGRSVRPTDASARAGGPGAGVPAEVNDHRLQLVEVAHHLVDAHGPLRAEVEVAAPRRHLELALDRAALLVEREPRGAARVGGEEEDDVRARRPRPSRPGSPRQEFDAARHGHPVARRWRRGREHFQPDLAHTYLHGSY